MSISNFKPVIQYDRQHDSSGEKKLQSITDEWGMIPKFFLVKDAGNVVKKISNPYTSLLFKMAAKNSHQSQKMAARQTCLVIFPNLKDKKRKQNLRRGMLNLFMANDIYTNIEGKCN